MKFNSMYKHEQADLKNELWEKSEVKTNLKIVSNTLSS